MIIVPETRQRNYWKMEKSYQYGYVSICKQILSTQKFCFRNDCIIISKQQSHFPFVLRLKVGGVVLGFFFFFLASGILVIVLFKFTVCCLPKRISVFLKITIKNIQTSFNTTDISRSCFALVKCVSRCKARTIMKLCSLIT